MLGGEKDRLDKPQGPWPLSGESADVVMLTYAIPLTLVLLQRIAMSSPEDSCFYGVAISIIFDIKF